MIEGLARLDVPELEPAPTVRGDDATISVEVARGAVPMDSRLHERHLTASERARSKRSSTKQVRAKKTSKALKEESEMSRARRERAAAQRAKSAARAAETAGSTDAGSVATPTAPTASPPPSA